MVNILTNTDYRELVSLMKERFVMKEEKGLDIKIKRIPDSDASGDLDPRVKELLIQQQQNKPPIDIDISQLPIETIRSFMGFENVDVTVEEIETTYKTIEGRNGKIPVRIYSQLKGQQMPAIVFFHGGAFFGGSLKAVENFCKCLAEKAEAVVVSVDYRLAPENKFPKGFHDCYDSVKWVHEHANEFNIHPDQIAVSGDSAGGNLSAACALMDRDLGTNMIKLQALIYPTVILSREINEYFTWDLHEYNIQNNHKLIESTITGLLELPDVSKIYSEQEEDLLNPYVSPLLANDLSNLPETVIITAEYDYLRLEGEAYAQRLSQAGVKVKTIRYNGIDHAFIDKIGIFPQAEDCAEEIASSIKQLFKNN
ncbi:alpha/beta hydrolase [Neobacillus drentensis]